MKTGFLPITGVWLVGCLACAQGSPVLSVLHAFGSSDTAAANPYAELIHGSDGALYGTTPVGAGNGLGTVFRMNKDGSNFAILKGFTGGTNDGSKPMAAVIEGSDGALYGTTDEGGEFGFGTVFKLNKDGGNFAVLKSFTGDDGAYPEARLLEASDGFLYGTASGGGTNDFGVIFRLAKDGSGFLPLLKFANTNGANPEGGLIEASDGLLYGTTFSGSNTNLGTVYRLQKDGGGFQVLKQFLSTSTVKTNGSGPSCRLVEATNGVLFGTASTGGANAFGTLFSMNKDGTGFKPLRQFGPSTNSFDARIPLAELISATDGLLYGTTYDGGTNANGTIFRIDATGSNYTVLASLSLVQGPAAALLEGSDGTLYGTTQLGGASGDGSVFKIQKDGSGFAILKSFSASGNDGASPYAAPTLASNGKLYGTTRLGGIQSAGSLYSIRADGLGYQAIASFPSDQGVNPMAALLEGTDGTLYGDTQFGGISNIGAVFSLQKDGSGLTAVYSSTNAVNGYELRAHLIQGSDGALYGTTVLGGNPGSGTAFKMNADGSGYLVLKNFARGATGPGANPVQALIEASDHQLYGTTYSGGTSNNGVIFSLSKDGITFTILKSLGNPVTEGANPASPLLEATDGLLYGTTFGGGATNNAGTVFRLNKDGSGFQVLRSFVGVQGDARHPSGKLVEGNDGALYGTTEKGGENDQGTLFTLGKDGTGYAVLISFGGALGQYPQGGIIMAANGALYGATTQGGAMGFGALFRYGEAIEEISDFQFLSGQSLLTCLGLPGTNYWIERTSVLGPVVSWVPLYSTNAPANGQFGYVDPTPSLNSAFYRLRR